VRYILTNIEKNQGGMSVEADSPSHNIEHILPESPGDGWSRFSEETAEAFVFRLGNFAILKTKENRDAGNRSFEDKKTIYAESQFKCTAILADEADWTPQSIERRQREMAQSAVAIWRVDVLSQSP
jgi:hypothetical protein